MQLNTKPRKLHGRIKGHAAVRLRRARLMAEPLCRICKSNGKVKASTTPDHIKPLALGGADTNDNIRCLCADCHRLVTAEQFGFKKKPKFGLDGWPVD